MIKGPGFVFRVMGSHFSAGDLTVGRVSNHPSRIKGEDGANHPLLHNLRTADGREQLIKVKENPKTGQGTVGGIVEGCRLEFTSGVALHGYTGGIDTLRASDWIIRDNKFFDIRSPDDGLAEHAIHFWSRSANTIVKRNRSVNSDCGIGFGLGSAVRKGGIIRNNFLHTTRDVEKGLESAPGARLLQKFFITEYYPYPIEYRLPATRYVVIACNLAGRRIVSRVDGSVARQGNIENACPKWFMDSARGNLRLATGLANAVDQAPGADAPADDVDCERGLYGSAPDIAADDYQGSVNTAYVIVSPWLIERISNTVARGYEKFEPIAKRLLLDPTRFKLYLAVIVVESASIALLTFVILRGAVRRRNQ